MTKILDRNRLYRLRTELNQLCEVLTSGTRTVLEYANDPNHGEFRQGISSLIGAYEILRQKESEIVEGLYLAERLLKEERENKKTKKNEDTQ